MTSLIHVALGNAFSKAVLPRSDSKIVCSLYKQTFFR